MRPSRRKTRLSHWISYVVIKETYFRKNRVSQSPSLVKAEFNVLVQAGGTSLLKRVFFLDILLIAVYTSVDDEISSQVTKRVPHLVEESLRVDRQLFSSE